MESTYLMIKPEAVRAGNWPDILAIVLRNRFRIQSMEMRTLSPDLARRFYAEHDGKPFFNDLVDYITSGTVIALRLQGEDAVQRLRQLVGATNPADAVPGTLRYMFGTSLQENAVHASDSTGSAERELRILFSS